MKERRGGVAEGEGSWGGRGRVRVGRLRPPRDSVLKRSRVAFAAIARRLPP
eukprot:COSAG02_NODE_112_length_35994_cov_12.152695_21_plen_51_part_00